MLVLLQEPEKQAEIMVVFYEAASMARGESHSMLMVTRQVFSKSKLGNVSSVEHTIGSQTPLSSKEDKGDD
jgi:hypothetical protein